MTELREGDNLEKKETEGIIIIKWIYKRSNEGVCLIERNPRFIVTYSGNIVCLAIKTLDVG